MNAKPVLNVGHIRWKMG